MNLRRFGAAIGTAAVLALTGCGEFGGDGIQIGIGDGTSSAPAVGVSVSPGSIDGALKGVLEAAGVTDVHPVANGTAAWAAIHGFKRCPVRFGQVDGTYRPQKLRLPNGSDHVIEGLPSQPSALEFTAYMVKNSAVLSDCAGTTPPEESKWPTT